jgi:hypothetical protein
LAAGDFYFFASFEGELEAAGDGGSDIGDPIAD